MQPRGKPVGVHQVLGEAEQAAVRQAVLDHRPCDAGTREAGRARLRCLRQGRLPPRPQREQPDTLPFEVPGPDGELRLECGGCRPEFVDPNAVPAQRAAEPSEVDVITRVQRAIPELDHCTYYALDYQGETLCVAVDFGLRGVWAFRDGELCGVDEQADPELKALLIRDGIRV